MLLPEPRFALQFDTKALDEVDCAKDAICWSGEEECSHLKTFQDLADMRLSRNPTSCLSLQFGDSWCFSVSSCLHLRDGRKMQYSFYLQHGEPCSSTFTGIVSCTHKACENTSLQLKLYFCDQK